MKPIETKQDEGSSPPSRARARLKLDTMADVLAFRRRLLRELYRGCIEESLARALFYGLSEFRSDYEMAEIERRIQRLEVM